MTQPPDDAALVARHDDLAKQLFWADVMLGEHSENILPEWRDRWWDTSADMPLSGPGFLLKWRTLAAVVATALEAKDRRIADLEKESLELGFAVQLATSDCEEAMDDAKAWRRTATDRQYMIDALVQMLGPMGLEVWNGWCAEGVERTHTSWGPDAASLTGEERAQVHLDVREAMKTAVPIKDFDGHIAQIKVRDLASRAALEPSDKGVG